MDDTRRFEVGIELIPKPVLESDSKGELEVLDSDGGLYYHNGTTRVKLASTTGPQTLTGQTIDGDDNTIQDLALTSLKTVPGDANNFLVRNGSGVVVSNTKAVPTGDIVGTTDTQTLTNKTIDGDDNTVQDLALTSLKTVLADANKVLQRDASGVVVSGSTIPAGNIVTDSSITTFTNKTIDGDDNTIQDLALSSLKTLLADANKVIQRDASGTVVSGSVIPSGNLITDSSTTTLSNKTLDNSTILTIKDTNLTIQDDSDITKQLKFQVSGITTGTIRTLTAPDADTTIVGTDATQTLTNKTINGSNNTITNISLTAGIAGILPIANGGTNSSTALNNNRVMQSSSGAIVEAAAITAARALVSDANGIPVASTTTATQIGFLDTLTSNVQTQLDNNGSVGAAYFMQNLGLATSVASNALTISLKQADGSTNPASGVGAVKIAYRSATVTSGAFSVVSTTGALSLVISSGSTLGHVSGQEHPIYIYAINNAGTTELAASCKYFGKAGIITTVAEGGAGGADTSTTMYSTTARTAVPYRLIGRILITEATAGTWASNASQLDIWPFVRQNTYGMYARQTTSQTIPNGASVTEVIFNTAVEAVNYGFFNTTTGLISVKEPMTLEVTGNFLVTGGTTGVEFFLYKNGSPGSLYSYLEVTVEKKGSGTAIVSLVPSDNVGWYCTAGTTDVIITSSNGHLNQISFNSVSYYD